MSKVVCSEHKLVSDNQDTRQLLLLVLQALLCNAAISKISVDVLSLQKISVCNVGHPSSSSFSLIMMIIGYGSI